MKSIRIKLKRIRENNKKMNLKTILWIIWIVWIFLKRRNRKNRILIVLRWMIDRINKRKNYEFRLKKRIKWKSLFFLSKNFIIKLTVFYWWYKFYRLFYYKMHISFQNKPIPIQKKVIINYEFRLILLLNQVNIINMFKHICHGKMKINL